MVGFGRNYNGQILGSTQWEWLEHTLEASSADFNIIISSIQVLTTNPVFESWGHFPLEKKKLLNLIKDTKPKGD